MPPVVDQLTFGPYATNCYVVRADHSAAEAVVVEGEAEIRCGEEVVRGGVGTLVTFDPGERHAVSSASGGRILLLLAPWPGEGHYRGSEPPAA